LWHANGLWVRSSTAVDASADRTETCGFDRNKHTTDIIVGGIRDRHKAVDQGMIEMRPGARIVVDFEKDCLNVIFSPSDNRRAATTG
jgi:hypothetical protein